MGCPFIVYPLFTLRLSPSRTFEQRGPSCAHFFFPRSRVIHATGLKVGAECCRLGCRETAVLFCARCLPPRCQRWIFFRSSRFRCIAPSLPHSRWRRLEPFSIAGSHRRSHFVCTGACSGLPREFLGCSKSKGIRRLLTGGKVWIAIARVLVVLCSVLLLDSGREKKVREREKQVETASCMALPVI